MERYCLQIFVSLLFDFVLFVCVCVRTCGCVIQSAGIRLAQVGPLPTVVSATIFGITCFVLALIVIFTKVSERTLFVFSMVFWLLLVTQHYLIYAVQIRRSPSNSVRLGVVRLGLVRLGLVRLGLVRLGLVRLGLVRLGLVRLGVVRLGVVRLGVVRLGVVRWGVVRRGVVWLGWVW